MGTISVSLPSDGTTADVSDYNTPITTIVNSINGNLDNSNIASGAAISTSKLADDAGITSAKIATNGVGASNLATNAIKLGKTSITSSINTASTTVVQATGLTQTVTIPAGGRSVKITVVLPYIQSSTATNVQVEIWSGTVGSGTRLQQAAASINANNAVVPVTTMAEDTPSAGSVTYNVGYYGNSGTTTIGAGATSPAFILVELI